MMNSKTHLLLTSSFLLCGLICNAQEQLSGSDKKDAHHEIPVDPYLPNAFDNKKVAPPYKFQDLQRSNSTIFTTQVNVDSNGFNILGDAANEPSIAVNPLNENQIVIGWRQFDNVASNFRQAGWGYSGDAGLSWTFPGVIEPGIFRSDPVLDYDSNGIFYYNSLTVDSVNNYSCDVFKSADGGVTWDEGTFAYGGDKQWMTIDRSTGTGSGNIYAFWTSFYSICPPNYFTRSTNGGSSYEECSLPDGNPYWGTLAVNNAGELYLGGTQGFDDYLLVVKSPNAQTAGSSISWNTPVSVFMDGDLTGWNLVNPVGLLGQADIEVDPNNDNVYILASMERSNFNGDPGDVMFARSTDGGTIWDPPVSVNDDFSETNTQWLGTMSVAPNGRIDAIWLDTRDADLGSDNSALYYSFSLDEGITWSENEMLSPLFDPHIGYPNQNKMGDYFDMVSNNEGAHLAWANTLNGEQDVYYSFIIPSIFIGVNELSANEQFDIMPNPVSAVLTLKSKAIEIFEVYNAVGVKMHEVKISSSGLVNTTIDVSAWTDGLYLIKAGTGTMKFIKTTSR